MPKQVPLTQGLFATVDDDDFEIVSQYKWFAAKGGKGFYATRSGGITMHRQLLSASRGCEVDHKDGDGLNNTRANLRVCSHKENLRNKKKQPNTSSRFKGVSITKNGKWRAAIEQNGVQLRLGTFDCELRAARQYDRAARIFFGSFAKTNHSLGLFETSPA